MCQPLSGIFLLAPLFPIPADLFLGALVSSVQDHQSSKKKEPETKIRPLPEARSGYLVVETKIREWVARRAHWNVEMDGL